MQLTRLANENGDSIMNQLITYVSALKDKQSSQSIVEIAERDTSFTDGDTLIHGRERLITFANGVVLKQQIEFDECSNSQSTQAVCSECWISYQIIFQPEFLSIQPKKKQFINRCQEAFWLRINKAHLFV